MATKKTSKLITKWESLSQTTQNIAKLISAIGVIGGMIFGIVGFCSNQFHSAIQEQIQPLTEEVARDVRETRLSTTRLELLSMIQHDPDNIAEIEELAVKYFVNLQGNSYMKSLFSKWAEEHGIDPAFMIK